MSLLEKVKTKKQSLRITFRENTNKYFANYRRRRLTRTDFTIISNNCWAGHVYRYYGLLPYPTPTIGLYIWADDYLRFLKNLREYLSSDLEFIKAEQSAHYADLVTRKHETKPIGRLSLGNETVEIVFLHYGSQKEAKEKWTRRLSRVNFDNLVIKNSFQNGFNEDMLREFEALPYKKKICFVHRSELAGRSAVYYKGFEKQNELLNDTIDFRKYVDLPSLFND